MENVCCVAMWIIKGDDHVTLEIVFELEFADEI